MAEWTGDWKFVPDDKYSVNQVWSSSHRFFYWYLILSKLFMFFSQQKELERSEREAKEKGKARKVEERNALDKIKEDREKKAEDSIGLKFYTYV